MQTLFFLTAWLRPKVKYPPIARGKTLWAVAETSRDQERRDGAEQVSDPEPEVLKPAEAPQVTQRQ